MLHTRERAGIDPPPRKWVGGSFPRPRAREFCLPAPDHPQSGLLGFRVSTPQPPYQGGLPRGKHRAIAGCAKWKCASVFSRPYELYKDGSFIIKCLCKLARPDGPYGPCGLYGPLRRAFAPNPCPGEQEAFAEKQAGSPQNCPTAIVLQERDYQKPCEPYGPPGRRSRRRGLCPHRSCGEEALEVSQSRRTPQELEATRKQTFYERKLHFAATG